MRLSSRKLFAIMLLCTVHMAFWAEAKDFSYPHKIERNSSLYDKLRSLEFEPAEIFGLVKAAEPHTDLNRIRPGVQFRIGHRVSPKLEAGVVEFKLSPTKFVYLEKQDSGQWMAQAFEKEVEIEVALFQGEVSGSLWSSAQEAEMGTVIIAQLAEIFAWQVDFSREVRKGDRWRLTVEKQFVDGQFIGWGRVLAAEYLNGERQFQAVLFEKNGQTRGYFAPDGSSLEKIFLKSPIEFARVSSRFSLKRFHPILKRARPHLGVDYAARSGTPVRSIGDGRVVYRAYTRGGGNTLAIRHTSIYKTRYLHLKGFAKGIKLGSQVKQGQLIGYVGSTGMSTGPHLHFEFYKRGRFVDPLKVEFPSAESIASQDFAEFTKISVARLHELPSYESPQHLVDARGLASSSDAVPMNEGRAANQ